MRALYFKARKNLGLLLSRMLSGKARYAAMQKAIYSSVDPESDFEVKEVIVGHYDAHEDYPYEQYLLRDVSDPVDKVALDFGCGP